MSKDLEIMTRVGKVHATSAFIDIPLGLAAGPHLLGTEILDEKLRSLGRQYMSVLGGFGTCSHEWAAVTPKFDHGVVLRLIPSEDYRECDDALVEARFIGRREDTIEGPNERRFAIEFGPRGRESRMVSNFILGMLDMMEIQADRLDSICSSFEMDTYRRNLSFNVFNKNDLTRVKSSLFV